MPGILILVAVVIFIAGVYAWETKDQTEGAAAKDIALSTKAELETLKAENTKRSEEINLKLDNLLANLKIPLPTPTPQGPMKVVLAEPIQIDVRYHQVLPHLPSNLKKDKKSDTPMIDRAHEQNKGSNGASKLIY